MLAKFCQSVPLKTSLVWDHLSFGAHRKCLPESDVMAELFEKMVKLARRQKQLCAESLSLDEIPNLGLSITEKLSPKGKGAPAHQGCSPWLV